MVPVIKDAWMARACSRSRASLQQPSGKARRGSSSPGDMSGASFTISSLGALGGHSASHPRSTRPGGDSRRHPLRTKPLWNGAEFVSQLMLPLSLSYDHRVIDGAAAARFTVFLTGVLSPTCGRALL